MTNRRRHTAAIFERARRQRLHTPDIPIAVPGRSARAAYLESQGGKCQPPRPETGRSTHKPPLEPRTPGQTPRPAGKRPVHRGGSAGPLGSRPGFPNKAPVGHAPKRRAKP